jgi:hypothetical protein
MRLRGRRGWCLLWSLVIAYVLLQFRGYRCREIPLEVLEHFRSLPKVEICVVSPAVSAGRSSQDKSHAIDAVDNRDFSDGYRVQAIALTDPTGCMRAIDYCDRFETGLGHGACFEPRYTVRDPDLPGDYILICFECSSLRYSFKDTVGTATISRAWQWSIYGIWSDEGLSAE